MHTIAVILEIPNDKIVASLLKCVLRNIHIKKRQKLCRFPKCYQWHTFKKIKSELNGFVLVMCIFPETTLC